MYKYFYKRFFVLSSGFYQLPDRKVVQKNLVKNVWIMTTVRNFIENHVPWLSSVYIYLLTRLLFAKQLRGECSLPICVEGHNVTAKQNGIF